jgi:hypothetical protein
VAHSCIWRPVDACASSDSDESMTPPTNAMSGSSTPVSDLGSVIGSESVASSQLPQLRATAEFSSDPSRGISLNGLASVQPTSRRVLERHIPMCMYEGWVDVDFLGPICIAHRKGKSVTQDDSALMLAVAEGRADPVTLVRTTDRCSLLNNLFFIWSYCDNVFRNCLMRPSLHRTC